MDDVQSDWYKFEIEICDLYRSLGFQVEHNATVEGQQVDVLAKRFLPGLGSFTTAIECKFKSTGSNVTNQDVQSIAHWFGIQRTQGKITACTIVTNAGFTPAAKVVAENFGINLTTRTELIRSLLDFKPYIERLKEDYYRDFGQSSNSWYISTRGTTSVSGSTTDLCQIVDDWRASLSNDPIVLLGGYGTGKSSFCRHYAVRMVDEPNSPIPVIIRLRDYPGRLKIESLIRDFLEEECDSSAPRYETFRRMYREGVLLLFFDGFDEMASKLDSNTIEANLIEIEKLAREGGRVILTCRPEFFVSRDEQRDALSPSSNPLIRRMSSYQPIELELWSNSQIERYIRRRLGNSSPDNSGHSVSDYVNYVKNMPELRDVASRAVHLELIVSLLPRLVDSGESVSRVQLYDLYIRQEMRRETIANRRLQVMPDDARLNLMQQIAAGQLLLGAEDIDYERASLLIRNKLNLTASEVDGVTRDFLNRSFLRRKVDSYSFAHKSLGEYLLAKELSSRLQVGGVIPLGKCKFSEAVAGMTFELSGGLQNLDRYLDSVGMDEMAILSGDNLAKLRFLMDSWRDWLGSLQFTKKAVGTQFRNNCLNYINAIGSYLDLVDRGAEHTSSINIQVTWRELLLTLHKMANGLQNSGSSSASG